MITMKKTFLLFALILPALGFAQSIRDYRYIIVPEKYEWQNEPNQYGINNLTKLIFEKYGWVACYKSAKLPDELALDTCKALYAEVLNQSGILNTTLVIVLRDCKGKTMFISQYGKSQLRNYHRAYARALSDASQSLARLDAKSPGKAKAPVKPAPAIN